MLACNIPSSKELNLLSESVGITSARSLDLLYAIDETIDSLGWISDRAHADMVYVSKEVERLRNCSGDEFVDPDNEICSDLEEAQDILGRLHRALVAKQQVALSSRELREDDGVVEAYQEAISNVGSLHESLEELRWAIMEHDAELDQSTSKEFDSVDELIADLRS